MKIRNKQIDSLEDVNTCNLNQWIFNVFHLLFARNYMASTIQNNISYNTDGLVRLTV